MLPSDRGVASPAVVDAYNVVEDGRHKTRSRLQASEGSRLSHPHTAINAMRTSGCC